MKILDEPCIVRFIGDVHADFTQYNKHIQCDYPTIQVGDFGFGFFDDDEAPVLQPKDFMIRGNHDNPAIAKLHPNYIPDGHIEHDIMFIGGSNSIDKDCRTKDFDWWEDEELSNAELQSMVDLVDKHKPKIIVSHDCPLYAIKNYIDMWKPYARTCLAFDQILYQNSPNLWVFGHYHKPLQFKMGKTVFVCCDIDQTVDIDLRKFLV